MAWRGAKKLPASDLWQAVAVLIMLSATGECLQCYWCGPLAEQVHRSQRAPPCDEGAINVTACDPGYTHCAVVASSPPFVESRYCVKFYQDECYALYCSTTKTYRMTCPCRGELCNGANTQREIDAFSALSNTVAKTHNNRISKRYTIFNGFAHSVKYNRINNLIQNDGQDEMANLIDDNDTKNKTANVEQPVGEVENVNKDIATPSEPQVHNEPDVNELHDKVSNASEIHDSNVNASLTPDSEPIVSESQSGEPDATHESKLNAIESHENEHNVSKPHNIDPTVSEPQGTEPNATDPQDNKPSMPDETTKTPEKSTEAEKGIHSVNEFVSTPKNMEDKTTEVMTSKPAESTIKPTETMKVDENSFVNNEIKPSMQLPTAEALQQGESPTTTEKPVEHTVTVTESTTRMTTVVMNKNATPKPTKSMKNSSNMLSFSTFVLLTSLIYVNL